MEIVIRFLCHKNHLHDKCLCFRMFPSIWSSLPKTFLIKVEEIRLAQNLDENKRCY